MTHLFALFNRVTRQPVLEIPAAPGMTNIESDLLLSEKSNYRAIEIFLDYAHQ